MEKQLCRMVCAVLLASLLPVSGRAQDGKRMSFTVEQAPWTLTLPAGDFKVAQRQFKPDGRSAYFMMSDSKTHLNLSFFIEPVRDCDNSKACRDMVWRMGNPNWENPQSVVQSQLGEVHYFEFLMPSFRGQPLRQQNMYAEFVVDGFWVDLHISKVLYQPAEHELFEQVVKAVRFEPKKKQTASNQ